MKRVFRILLSLLAMLVVVLLLVVLLLSTQPGLQLTAAIISSLELADKTAGAGDLGTLRTAVDANPKDPEARHDLALALYAADQREEAIDELLLILRRDRAWRDGAAKELLLKLFDLLGADDPLVPKARRRMNNYILN